MHLPADIGQFGVYFTLFMALYFEVFLLLSYLEKKPAEKSNTLPKHYPSVAMIVPCYNEEKTLAQTVHSLLNLEYPKDKLQVVVVDDGSQDCTKEIGESLAAQFPANVIFYTKPNGGKYTA